MDRTFKTDRTVKALLALIAAGLLANLLRLAPTPALAAPAAAMPASVPVIGMEQNGLQAIVVQDGVAYEIDYSGDLKVNSRVRLK